MSQDGVVYRDRWLLVVDKPFGVPTQAPRGGGGDLYTSLKARETYVGLHHRLDQVASGLVLFTVHPDANAAVAKAFREHTIERTYRAVLMGEARATTWTSPVDGRPATTEVRVAGRANGMTAVELRLETGRKHQIRKQAAMAGAPVAGDRRYGGDAGRAWPRLALHAARLSLAHPMTGEPLDLESPLPEDLSKLWRLAGGPD